MKATTKMINEMIQTLERELGEEHYYLCRAEADCFSQDALSAIWKAIEKSHLNVLQTYLKVVIGQDGLNTLLKFYESEEEIYSIICEETEFFLNEPHFDELYNFIPNLLNWVEEVRNDSEEEFTSSEEAA